MLKICYAKNIIIPILLMVLGTVLTNCNKQSIPDPVSANTILDFENKLDNIRLQSNIPGMVAGIIKNGNIIWIKNYGYADIQKKLPVTNATIFHLASLTKTFASTIIIQLVKENKVNLYAPVALYGIYLTEKDTVRVIHLLTHTSEGVPGSTYKYNGDRYALLSQVIQSAAGEPFHKLTNDRISKVLGLNHTAPSDMKLASGVGFDTNSLIQNMAQGYNSDGNQPVEYPANFSTAAGLISNIEDMLKYASAFDENLLLTEELKAKVFSPMISNDGKSLPYGLGWFIQQKEGIKFSWHYGYWIGMSSLIIRIPEKKLSFILMANSDMLSAPYPLGNGDIWVSPYSREFLKSFALPGAKL